MHQLTGMICKTRPVQMLQQNFSIKTFLHLGSSRSQTGTHFFSFRVQSAWRYLCKGAVCNVSGKRTLSHQSQSGPFISFALHVCGSVFDPVCVSLVSLFAYCSETERERQKVWEREYVWWRCWCCLQCRTATSWLIVLMYFICYSLLMFKRPQSLPSFCLNESRYFPCKYKWMFLPPI